MPITASRVAVTTTQTRLDSPTTVPMMGGSIAIKNPSSSTGTVAIGGDGVTPANGFELEPGAVMAIDADNWSRVFAITSAGTVTVQLFEARA